MSKGHELATMSFELRVGKGQRLLVIQFAMQNSTQRVWGKRKADGTLKAGVLLLHRTYLQCSIV